MKIKHMSQKFHSFQAVLLMVDHMNQLFQMRKTPFSYGWKPQRNSETLSPRPKGAG